MKDLQRITKKINDITLKIEQSYPELYQYLEENPMTLPSDDSEGVNKKAFQEYLESLEELIANHKEQKLRSTISENSKFSNRNDFRILTDKS
ncbi:hypothetical protein [uncultured Arcticibacterium sp.]|uniref:hypothetical protein n=1 Tax=uncultured Arcticibacterium sp. TaxID=2173042 RepID=UPI0030F937A1